MNFFEKEIARTQDVFDGLTEKLQENPGDPDLTLMQQLVQQDLDELKVLNNSAKNGDPGASTLLSVFDNFSIPEFDPNVD